MKSSEGEDGEFRFKIEWDLSLFHLQTRTNKMSEASSNDESNDLDLAMGVVRISDSQNRNLSELN